MSIFHSVLVLCIFLKCISGKITVNQTPTTFQVFVDGLEIFSHNDAIPSFFISRTNVTFEEHNGNFKINESHVSGPIALNNYYLEQENIGPNNTKWIATIANMNWLSYITLEFWDGDMKNEVELGLHFKITLPSSYFNRIIFRMPSEEGEYIYGLGEQFSYFNMNGHKYNIWTREQGVGRNQSDLLTQLIELYEPGTGGDFDYTYWPQASFVSSRRYLFVLESADYSIFNFENSSYKEISIQSERDIVEGYLVRDQNSLMSLVQNISKIFGRQPELPEWVSSGAILGVQGGTDKMLQFVSEAEDHGVALSAMWIQDWSGKITTSFGTRVFWNWAWNEEWYPDLDRVIPELKADKGIRVLSYINPSLNIEGDIFKEGDSMGYFLRQENNVNETYIQDFGQFFCGTIDFWNSDAVDWYKGIIKDNLLRFGFAGWMADFGEYTPLDSTTVNSSVSLSAQERHNLLPILWAKLNREAVEEAGKLNETMFWTRSGGAEASRYTTMLWGGDQNVDWSFSDGLPSTITAAFSSAMSGMGLFHFDIGGFTTIQALNLRRSKELFLRSAEYAVFTPVMRTHEGNQPTANHQVYSDVDTWTRFARLTQIFKTLSNYSRTAIRQNSLHGIPVMRPLFLQYESDPESFLQNYEYMYGDDLLVAPVLYPGAQERTVYLPPDDWIHLWDTSKTIHTGPINVTVPSPLGYTPAFYRRHSPWSILFQEIYSKFL